MSELRPQSEDTAKGLGDLVESGGGVFVWGQRRSVGAGGDQPGLGIDALRLRQFHGDFGEAR